MEDTLSFLPEVPMPLTHQADPLHLTIAELQRRGMLNTGGSVAVDLGAIKEAIRNIGLAAVVALPLFALQPTTR
jgi:hypothetical protein